MALEPEEIIHVGEKEMGGKLCRNFFSRGILIINLFFPWRGSRVTQHMQAPTYLSEPFFGGS